MSQLEFKLRMQEFIELLHRKNDSVVAVQYGRKNLIKFIKADQD